MFIAQGFPAGDAIREYGRLTHKTVAISRHLPGTFHRRPANAGPLHPTVDSSDSLRRLLQRPYLNDTVCNGAGSS